MSHRFRGVVLNARSSTILRSRTLGGEIYFKGLHLQRGFHAKGRTKVTYSGTFVEFFVYSRSDEKHQSN